MATVIKILTLAIFSLTADALVILQYHHIGHSTPVSTSTSPERFYQHLQLIEESDYEVLSLKQVQQYITSNKTLPDKSVLITFDDGYSSIFTHAYPALKQKNWPFVVFINTQPIDKQVKGFMTWDQLRTLSANRASIANHSVSHPHLLHYEAGESAESWQTWLLKEINEAQNRIKEETGHDYKVFSYPYGEYNRHIQDLIEKSGYIAMGQHSGAVAVGQISDIPRFPMGGNYGEKNDFLSKLRSKPFPPHKLVVRSEAGIALIDGVLPLHVKRPVLDFTFTHSALAASTKCFVSQQGESTKEIVSELNVHFKAKSPLPAGRSRYNCTAPSDEAHRFYWLSVPLVVKKTDGTWANEY